MPYETSIPAPSFPNSECCEGAICGTLKHAEICSSWWPLHTGQMPKKSILKKREIDKYILAS
jgi:hypothetical protein